MIEIWSYGVGSLPLTLRWAIFYLPREHGSWELGRIIIFYLASRQVVLNQFLLIDVFLIVIRIDFPIFFLKEMLYAVRCLKSNEDMIFALARQFKQLSHEPEKFRWLNGIRTPWSLRCRCSALTNWAMKSHSGEQDNLLGSCFPLKEMSYVM